MKFTPEIMSKKKCIWREWLVGFRKVIESKTPRKVYMDLYQCELDWPRCPNEIVPDAEVFGEILEALVQLRHSRCYGRVGAEAGLIRRLSWVINDIVFFDNPRDHEGDLFTDYEEPSGELRARNLSIFKQSAEYAVTALRDKGKRERKTEERVLAAFDLLKNLSYRGELSAEMEEGFVFAREVIYREDDPSARAAVGFLDSYHIRRDLEFSSEVLSELKALEGRSRNEDVVFKINDVLIEIGESNEFAAMDRMDELRGSSS